VRGEGVGSKQRGTEHFFKINNWHENKEQKKKVAVVEIVCCEELIESSHSLI
jgi:hypothetical protein